MVKLMIVLVIADASYTLSILRRITMSTAPPNAGVKIEVPQLLTFFRPSHAGFSKKETFCTASNHG